MSSVDELMAAARADVESGWLPACQVAVGKDGDIVAFETFGAADDATRFCVFSATKPFVASAVWILIQEGRLDVSRPVADYIPEFGTAGKDIVTVEQVMLHTAGFPNARMRRPRAPIRPRACAPSGSGSSSSNPEPGSSITAGRPIGCWPS